MEMVVGKVDVDMGAGMVGVDMAEEFEAGEEAVVIVDVEEAMAVGKYNKSSVVTMIMTVQG